MKDTDSEIMFNLYVESLRETRLSDEMPHLIEEGVREFFRGMNMKDVVDKIKERLSQSDEFDPDAQSKLRRLTNGMMFFTLPYALGKGGRQLYDYLSGNMSEENFFKWLETFMTQML